MTQSPYRLALVGIDGSGKTSVVTRLRERVGVEGELVTLTSPVYHETPNAPFQLLSRQMQAVSFAADALAVPELKGAMLYLQMTLYGRVEQCLVETFRPRCVISDRHGLVDTLAYGPVYRLLLTNVLDGAHWDPLVREQLGEDGAHALDATIDWHERLARRLGLETDFWELPQEMAPLFERPLAEQIAELSRRYETELPDAVVLLDLEPAEALRRSTGRKGTSSEMHESAALLGKLRKIYATALGTLEQERPDVVQHRIDCTELTIDETLDAVLDRLPAGLAPAPARP